MNTAITSIHYPFAHHARRITILTGVCALVLVVALVFALLANVHELPASLDVLIIPASILAVIAFIFLLPVLIFLYGYRRSGVWIEGDRIHVHFPGESQQEMEWSEARFAVNEGEEYLRVSKGKEGLGHLFGETRYIRLHLEGMLPEQRSAFERALAGHVEVRRPRGFTLMTLLNAQGEMVARGRLYLFEDAVLCAENRGEKRVFFYAPLKELSWVKQRGPFYVGRLECEAFTMRYEGKEYVVMLGYETTISSNIGTTSHWAVTGSAEEWVGALSSG